MKRIKRTITIRRIELTSEKVHNHYSNLEICPLCHSPISQKLSRPNSVVENESAQSKQLNGENCKKIKGENMFKKYLPIMLIVLVVNLLCSLPVIATTKEEEAAKFAEKVKANVIKLGTGKDAKVEVKLKDGTKIKGYIRQIYEGSFVVIDDKTGASTEIPYPQVKQAKGKSDTYYFVFGIVGIAALIALLIVAGKSD